MKVKECSNFKKDFPELFDWGTIDSIQLENVATTIVNWIAHDIRSEKRNLVPGLRVALNIISEIADA